MDDLLDRTDAVGLADAIRAGEVSEAEVLEATMARIDERNPAMNAITTVVEPEPAADGRLRGVPFAIKDLHFAMRGTVATHGSRYFADAPVDDHDAEVVRRYRAAGLVLVGRSNSPELGLSTTTEPALFGPCANPLDPTRSAGGSSGGAASAVASGMLTVAHASDGGGSIRIPSSACGLFGLKPSRGRVSFGPDAGENWSGYSTTHVVSRTVRDSAVLLDLTSGLASGDPYVAPHSRRFIRGGHRRTAAAAADRGVGRLSRRYRARCGGPGGAGRRGGAMRGARPPHRRGRLAHTPGNGWPAGGDHLLQHRGNDDASGGPVRATPR